MVVSGVLGQAGKRGHLSSSEMCACVVTESERPEVIRCGSVCLPGCCWVRGLSLECLLLNSRMWLRQCLPLPTETGCVLVLWDAFCMDHRRCLLIFEVAATEIFSQIKMLHRN